MSHDSESDSPSPNASSNSYGSVLSILLMVLIIVFGAFYVWHKRIAADRSMVPTTADTPIAPIGTTSPEATTNSL